MSNVGTRAITHIQAYATLGTGGVIAEDWNGILPSGQIMEDTFHAQFVVAASNAGSYVLCGSRGREPWRNRIAHR